MKKMTRVFWAAVIFIGVATMTFSCSSSKKFDSTAPYFITNSDDTFETNEIGKATENADFTLIFPKYLPECIAPEVTIEGYLKGQHSIEDEQVTFYIDYYGKEGNDCVVLIDEKKGPIISIPSSEENASTIDVLGVNILEERRTILVSNTGPIEGFSYDWEQNGTHITLAVSNDIKTDIISNNEAIKIIESMINS